MAVKKVSKQPDEKHLFAEMEKRAYEIYLERKHNDLPGDDTTDWYQAEQEIRQKYATSKPVS